MKKFLLLTLLIFTGIGSTYAQKTPIQIEGKPSYKETTDFIKTYFAEDFFRNGQRFKIDWSRGKLFFEKKFSINDIAFTDKCNLNIEYKVTSTRDRRYDGTETYKRSIDLSLTEGLGIQRIGETEIFVYGLVFNVKNLPKRDEMDLPFARMEAGDGDDENFNKLEEDKLYKAFNHLRKLCGAPEPLNF